MFDFDDECGPIETWAQASSCLWRQFPWNPLHPSQKKSEIEIARDEIATLRAAGFFITFDGIEVTEND